MRDARCAGKVLFVEDYDINMGRLLVQGVDVWLNTPRRPLEACGTSGQKVVLNGGLNLSILDGWWAEAYDGAKFWPSSWLVPICNALPSTMSASHARVLMAPGNRSRAVLRPGTTGMASTLTMKSV